MSLAHTVLCEIDTWLHNLCIWRGTTSSHFHHAWWTLFNFFVFFSWEKCLFCLYCETVFNMETISQIDFGIQKLKKRKVTDWIDYLTMRLILKILKQFDLAPHTISIICNSWKQLLEALVAVYVFSLILLILTIIFVQITASNKGVKKLYFY